MFYLIKTGFNFFFHVFYFFIFYFFGSEMYKVKVLACRFDYAEKNAV